jgi:hypothetical protein
MQPTALDTMLFDSVEGVSKYYTYVPKEYEIVEAIVVPAANGYDKDTVRILIRKRTK